MSRKKEDWVQRSKGLCAYHNLMCEHKKEQNGRLTKAEDFHLEVATKNDVKEIHTMISKKVDKWYLLILVGVVSALISGAVGIFWTQLKPLNEKVEDIYIKQILVLNELQMQLGDYGRGGLDPPRRATNDP